MFKSTTDELSTDLKLKANPMWCRDCEAEAKAACFEQHVLCGLGLMQRETAVELEAAWAGRAALLHTLAEDVRAEKQQLQEERDTYTGSQQQLGLSALRSVLAAAKEHPLRGLPAGHPEGGLLRRALGALRREEELDAREAAVRDKELTLAEREADQDEMASAQPGKRRRLDSPELRWWGSPGTVAPSEAKEVESAEAARASFSDDGSDISSEEEAESQPVRHLPARQPVPANDSSSESDDSSSEDPSKASDFKVAVRVAAARKSGGHYLPFAASSSNLGIPRKSQPSPSSFDSDDSSTADERSAAAVPGLASLPEELLQRILALVPLWWSPLKKLTFSYRHEPRGVPDLLSLRLVCRRWARSVLSPAVWRHRELDYNYDTYPALYGLPRLVPVVGKLTCAVGSRRIEDDIKALINSPIQVRSLRVTVHVSNPACLLAKPCEELHLTLLRSTLYMNKLIWLLQNLDSLQGLKALTLDHLLVRNDGIKDDPLKHTFLKLTGLTKLSLGRYLHVDTVRSMLEASKLTLRELDCGGYDVAHLVASTASQLRCIRVAGDSISANLMHLRQLEHLEVADITPEQFPSSPSGTQKSDIVIGFLNSSPTVPREVHLTLKDFKTLHHWNTVHGMRRVSHLTMDCRARVSTPGKPKDWHRLTAPLTLRDVMILELDLGQYEFDGPMWQGWRAAWLDSTAPKLREVHVVQGDSKECCVPCREWLEVLREKRPRVKICFKK